MIEARCCRGDCTKPATVLPVILVWANRTRHPLGEPARIQLGLPICAGCRFDITVRDLVDRPAWVAMAATFIKQRNGIAPDLRTARIEWIDLTSREAREFIASTPLAEKPKGGLIH